MFGLSIAGIFAGAKTIKFWLIAAVVVSIIGSVTYFVMDYRDTLQQLAVKEAQVADLEKDLSTVNQQIAKERKKTQELREANSKISSQYLDSIREIQEMKKNIEYLKKNPEEAEKKIEQSFNNFMNDISCITGDQSQCPKSK